MCSYSLSVGFFYFFIINRALAVLVMSSGSNPFRTERGFRTIYTCIINTPASAREKLLWLRSETPVTHVYNILLLNRSPVVVQWLSRYRSIRISGYIDIKSPTPRNWHDGIILSLLVFASIIEMYFLKT